MEKRKFFNTLLLQDGWKWKQLEEKSLKILRALLNTFKIERS